MGISMNGPSGIDTAYIIDSLVDLERNKVRRVEAKRDAYDIKIQAYSKLHSYVSELGAKAWELSKESAFDVFTETSSNEDILSFSAGVGSTEGRYDIGVYSLASREKMISTDGLISSQSATLADMGLAGGTISIEGTEILIEDTDTVQDIRMKINNATTVDGDKLSATASVLKVSDTNFRLVLTSRDTGESGVTYADVAGTVFQDLGILDAAGEKGTTAQSLRSADDIRSVFGTLNANDVIQYAGTDHAGNEVTNSFIVAADSTVDDLVRQIAETFHGAVDVSIDDATGELVMTDRISGDSQLLLSSLNIAGGDYAVNIEQAGRRGDGVLSVGSDAFFSIDGITVQSDTNDAEGYISGVTLNLNKADVGESVSISIERDLEGIQEKVQEMLDAYNALLEFADEATDYGDPEDEDSVRGELAGDQTVGSIVSQIRQVFQKQFSLFGGSYTNMTMIGIKTNTNSGGMEIDDDMFRKAISEEFDEVVRLFTTNGSGENANVSLGRYQSETESGLYTLEEVDADHFTITRDGSAETFTSEARMGDIVSFSEGPASGLSLTIPVGAVGVGNTTTFTFAKGFGEYMKEVTDKLTDAREGVISMRQESWRGSITRSEDRIDRLEERVEQYRERLVKQFSNMEQVLSDLQAQSANMMSMLGYGGTS